MSWLKDNWGGEGMGVHLRSDLSAERWGPILVFLLVSSNPLEVSSPTSPLNNCFL